MTEFELWRMITLCRFNLCFVGKILLNLQSPYARACRKNGILSVYSAVCQNNLIKALLNPKCNTRLEQAQEKSINPVNYQALDPELRLT